MITFFKLCTYGSLPGQAAMGWVLDSLSHLATFGHLLNKG